MWSVVVEPVPAAFPESASVEGGIAGGSGGRGREALFRPSVSPPHRSRISGNTIKSIPPAELSITHIVDEFRLRGRRRCH